jgi:hypothetical protein
MRRRASAGEHGGEGGAAGARAADRAARHGDEPRRAAAPPRGAPRQRRPGGEPRPSCGQNTVKPGAKRWSNGGQTRANLRSNRGQTAVKLRPNRGQTAGQTLATSPRRAAAPPRGSPRQPAPPRWGGRGRARAEPRPFRFRIKVRPGVLKIKVWSSRGRAAIARAGPPLRRSSGPLPTVSRDAPRSDDRRGPPSGKAAGKLHPIAGCAGRLPGHTTVRRWPNAVRTFGRPFGRPVPAMRIRHTVQCERVIL